MSKKQTWFVMIVLAVALVACLAVDLMLPSYHIAVTVIKKAAVYALVAVSMNLLNGFTGLFSLGQAGFMLLGAYAYGVLTIPVDKRAGVYQYFDGGAIHFSIPEIFSNVLGDTVGTTVGMLAALLVGGILAALVAYLIGLPVLRLKSDYLAIATLGFAEILRAFFQWNALGPITNGSNLLKSYPTFSHATPYVVLAGVMIAFIVLLIRSTYGRAFKAIRDDEVAAEAMGINLSRHKRLAFVISSFFAGIGGGMMAMYMGTIAAARGHRRHWLHHRFGAGQLPVYLQLRVAAAGTGLRYLPGHQRAGPVQKRLPYGGVLHHHYGDCAVLPPWSDGRQGTS